MTVAQKLNISEIVGGADALTVEHGQRVFERLVPALQAHQLTILDFSGVRVFASPFFNAAIGQLMEKFEPGTLNTFLSFQDLNAAGRVLLRQVIENARRFYTDPQYRLAQEQTLQEMSEACC